jgi:hypothetical protein
MKSEYNVYEIKLNLPVFIDPIIFSSDLVDGILHMFNPMSPNDHFSNSPFKLKMPNDHFSDSCI